MPRRPPPPRVVPSARQAGQASVELVVLLPVAAALVALLWQAVVTGVAVWHAEGAASAAARAVALGADRPAALRAARAALPPALGRRVGVRVGEAGVTAALPVHAVLGGRRVLTVTARARMAPQP